MIMRLLYNNFKIRKFMEGYCKTLFVCVCVCVFFYFILFLLLLLLLLIYEVLFFLDFVKFKFLNDYPQKHSWSCHWMEHYKRCTQIAWGNGKLPIYKSRLQNYWGSTIVILWKSCCLKKKTLYSPTQIKRKLISPPPHVFGGRSFLERSSNLMTIIDYRVKDTWMLLHICIVMIIPYRYNI